MMAEAGLRSVAGGNIDKLIAIKDSGVAQWQST